VNEGRLTLRELFRDHPEKMEEWMDLPLAVINAESGCLEWVCQVSDVRASRHQSFSRRGDPNERALVFEE